MNCREFLNEFEERNALTEAAMLHLNNCADCVKTSREQTQIWQMIDDLPRARAPKTFDFAVKARIAATKPTDFQPRFLPVLRYALPLCAVVLILGFVIFKTAYFSNTSAPQVAQTNPQPPIEKKIIPGNFSLTNQNVPNENPSVSLSNAVAVKPKDDAEAAANKYSPERRDAAPKNKSKEFDGSGSHDSAVSHPSSKFPSGLNPNQTNVASPNLGSQKSLSVEEILSFLGIESVSENGERRVKSVKQNSIAERSGVKNGDVVEAIDGRKISDEPIRSKTIEGNTLTVRRGAAKMEIALHN